MQRRDFLTLAASGTAYSLLVRVDGRSAAATEIAAPRRTVDDIRAELIRIAPAGDVARRRPSRT